MSIPTNTIIDPGGDGGETTPDARVEDVTADTVTDAQADVTDDAWTPTPSSYLQALPFTIDRPEVGDPMTDAEVTDGPKTRYVRDPSQW